MVRQTGAGRWSVRGAAVAMAAGLVVPLAMTGAVAAPGHGGDGSAAVLAAEDPALDWNNYEKILLTKDTGEPIDLAVLPDSRVLHTARDGVVRLTDPSTGLTTEAGKLDVYHNSEDGLQGIAIDPDFEENNWVYLVYAPRVMAGTSPTGVAYPETTPEGSAPEQLPDGEDAETYWDQWVGYNVLSRFQWDGASNTLDLTSEQEIIKITAQRGQCCHVGADIAFDGDGNLYLSSGDNTPAGTPGANGFTPINNAPGMNPGFDSRRGAGNSNDLRGKILRIDVRESIAEGAEPGPGSTYDIPAGNLFDSPEYDPDLVREEIYVMGVRNPFRMDVDAESGALVWGDYGPDSATAQDDRGPMGYVEWQLTTEPMNGGWPYCHGPNDGGAYNEWDYETGTPGEFFDCAAPVNNSTWNTGLTELPAVTQPQIWYGDSVGDQPWDELIEFSTGRGQAPMGGPIFRYDPANESPAQFPEYWDGKAFMAEFSMDYVAAITLDELSSAGQVTQIENFLPNAFLSDAAQPIWDNVMDMEFGPDGSMYVLEYGDGFFRQNPDAGLYRVDYAEGNKTPQAFVTADPISSSDVPLTVTFDASDSRDPEGGDLTYEWDFDGSGEFVEGGPTATHTYENLGQFHVTLRVTDEAGKFGLATVQITVGNTAPEVSLSVPNGSLFSWGDDVPVSVTVTDAEDDAAGGEGVEYERTLTARSTVGQWLSDALGGPILLDVLGVPADALAAAAGVPLEDLVALSGGALTAEMVADLLAAYADAPDPEPSTVDCSRVNWTFGLGHNEHAHPEVSGTGCEFTIETSESALEHGAGEKLYGTLVVTYTDNPQGDVPAATGEATLVLKPAEQQAEWFDDAQGVEIVADESAEALKKVASFDVGDWFAFRPMTLQHAPSGEAIDLVTARASGEGTLSLRWDEYRAEPFAELTFTGGAGWQDVAAVFDSIPEGSGTVYVTTTGGLEVDSLVFGVSDVEPTDPPTDGADGADGAADGADGADGAADGADGADGAADGADGADGAADGADGADGQTPGDDATVPGGALPDTGAGVMPAVVLGALLLIAGAGVVLRARRERA
ncbi:PQQ-dependent sugar dehydrogenase [Pseudactinotalea sp. HY158]|uniref:PQQ-dependent sugar dehydrogenase n=1 Tax=Pseudactinotalea sp. HY158 TaxID=2654547 RepID=UPI00129CE374|nr:PQQ-dependent sugar dehydrogenase [Pseudactinotalea sp. HY158]QGH70026.1 PKD domain-containing protein [Pseudactinotalea sp. HY158]